MTNRSKTLYTGVTNDLMKRVYQHQHHFVPGFTSKYKIDRLIYYETTTDIHEALKREKQIKGWLRSKKITLIESVNPEWTDLRAMHGINFSVILKPEGLKDLRFFGLRPQNDKS